MKFNQPPTFKYNKFQKCQARFNEILTLHRDMIACSLGPGDHTVLNFATRLVLSLIVNMSYQRNQSQQSCYWKIYRKLQLYIQCSCTAWLVGQLIPLVLSRVAKFSIVCQKASFQTQWSANHSPCFHWSLSYQITPDNIYMIFISIQKG